MDFEADRKYILSHAWRFLGLEFLLLAALSFGSGLVVYSVWHSLHTPWPSGPLFWLYPANLLCIAFAYIIIIHRCVPYITICVGFLLYTSTAESMDEGDLWDSARELTHGLDNIQPFHMKGNK